MKIYFIQAETSNQQSVENDRQIRALEAELKTSEEENARLRSKLKEAPAEVAKLKQQMKEAKAAAARELEEAEKKAETAEKRYEITVVVLSSKLINSCHPGCLLPALTKSSASTTSSPDCRSSQRRSAHTTDSGSTIRWRLEGCRKR